MSALLKEVKRIDAAAAYKLEQLRFCSDSDLLFLTREDLCELFPGENNLRRRKAIFDAIHKEKPIDLLLKDLKNFIPDESLRAALSNNGVLLDYLHILKDIKAQMNNVQSFLDAHISLLEDMKKPKPQQEHATESFEVVTAGNIPSYSTVPHPSTSASSVKLQTQKPPTENFLQGAQSLSSAGTSVDRTSGPAAQKAGPTSNTPQEKRTVKYKTVISGKTLGAHRQILDRIQGQVTDTVSLELKETPTDAQSDIILVFCPIVSRSATDINEALKKVEGPEPVILVVMYHSYEARYAPSTKNWTSNVDVVLNVNVFYHDTKSGLLKCQSNDDAISQLRRELQNYGDVTIEKPVAENPPAVESENDSGYSYYNNYGGTSKKRETEKGLFSRLLQNF